VAGRYNGRSQVWYVPGRCSSPGEPRQHQESAGAGGGTAGRYRSAAGGGSAEQAEVVVKSEEAGGRGGRTQKCRYRATHPSPSDLR